MQVPMYTIALQSPYHGQNRIEIFPILFFGIWTVAQISVFWFALFRIVPIMGSVLFALIYVLHFTSRVTVFPQMKLILLFLCVYLVMLISCYWSPDPESSMYALLDTLAAGLPAFFAGEYLARRYNLRSIFIGAHLVPVFLAPQFLYNQLTFGDWAIYDIFSIRTVAGTLLSGIAPIVFGYFLTTKSILSLLLTIVCTISVFILQTRTGVIAIGLGIMLVIFIFNAKIALNGAVLLLPFILFVSVLSQASSIERFSAGTSFDVSSDVLGELSVDRSLTVDLDRRLHTFITLEMLKNNPVFGGGYYSVYLNNKFEFGFHLPAHGYIGTFAEIGLFGLIFALGFLYIIFSQYKLFFGKSGLFLRENRFDALLVISFLMILFTGFFHQAFESPNFTLISGLLVGRLAHLRFGLRYLLPVLKKPDTVHSASFYERF